MEPARISKVCSDHRNIADAAIGHDALAAECLVHVRLHFAPESAVVRRVVKILNYHPTRIGLRGNVIQIVVTLLHITLTGKRDWVLGAHGDGFREADLGR